MDKRNEYTYGLVFSNKGNYWYITHIGKRGYSLSSDKPIWTFPWNDAHSGMTQPPPEVCAKYEELIEYDPSYEGEPFINLVEIADDGEGGRFNQPCVYGNLCEGYAVYCHNERWLYSPGKCGRTWYTGGKTRDEDCPGFAPNPNFNPKEPAL